MAIERIDGQGLSSLFDDEVAEERRFDADRGERVDRDNRYELDVHGDEEGEFVDPVDYDDSVDENDPGQAHEDDDEGEFTLDDLEGDEQLYGQSGAVGDQSTNTWSVSEAVEQALLDSERSNASSIAWARPQGDPSGALKWSRLIPIAVLLTLVPAVIAGFLASRQTERFEATVDVEHVVTEASDGRTALLMANQQLRATSRSVLEEAAALEGVDVDALVEDSQVSLAQPIDDTASTVLRFDVRADSPELAERLLEAQVLVYVDSVPEREDGDLVEATDEVIASLLEARGDALTDLQILRARGGSIAEVERTQQRVDQIFRDIEVQTSLRAALDSSPPTVSVSSVGAAFASPDPVEPRPLFAAAAGLALGLVLAAGFLFVSAAARNW